VLATADDRVEIDGLLVSEERGLVALLIAQFGQFESAQTPTVRQHGLHTVVDVPFAFEAGDIVLHTGEHRGWEQPLPPTPTPCPSNLSRAPENRLIGLFDLFGTRVLCVSCWSGGGSAVRMSPTMLPVLGVGPAAGEALSGVRLWSRYVAMTGGLGVPAPGVGSFNLL